MRGQLLAHGVFVRRTLPDLDGAGLAGLGFLQRVRRDGPGGGLECVSELRFVRSHSRAVHKKCWIR